MNDDTDQGTALRSRRLDENEREALMGILEEHGSANVARAFGTHETSLLRAATGLPCARKVLRRVREGLTASATEGAA